MFFQCINEEGFGLFLKTYLEVEDFPADLCQRLFRSFQNPEAAQEDAASKVLHSTVAQPAACGLLMQQQALIQPCRGLLELFSFLTTRL